MGPIAARKARSVVQHVRQVIAIEILSACQALDLVAPLLPGRGVRAVHEAVRRAVPFMEHDRIVADDLRVMDGLAADGSLRAAAEQAVGALR